MRVRVSSAAPVPALTFVVPLLTFAAADGRLPVSGTKILAVAVSLAVVVLVGRRPVAALCTLVAYVPIQQTLLAYLWSRGLPAGVARDAGYLKEVVVAGLVVAAVRLPTAERRPLTRLDRVLVAYGAVVLGYLAAPSVLHGFVGDQTPYVRLAAARVEYLFPLLFLAVRRFRWDRRQQRHVENSLLAVSAVVAASGLYELADASGFDHFIVDTVRQLDFARTVLGSKDVPLDGVVRGSQASSGFTRNGGLFVDPLTLGFFLVAPLAVGLRRMLRERGQVVTAVITAACAGVLVNTFTRSAILAGLIAVLVVVLPSLRGGRPRAVTVAGAALGALVLTAPLFGAATLVERIAGAANGQDASATAHRNSTSAGFARFERSPLGLGLGSNPATGATQGSTNTVTTENAYLQVGLELGWAGLALFAAFILATLAELRLLVVRGPPGALAELGALAGLTVGGFLLQVWVSFAVSLAFWALLGSAFAAADDVSADSVPVDGPDNDRVAGASRGRRLLAVS